MGRRGPRPEPTALKIARGNPGKRAINHDEPDPGAFDLTPPPDLDGIALKKWNAIAPGQAAAGVLKSGNEETFASYCQILAQVKGYEALVRKVGLEAAHSVGYSSLLVKLHAQEKQFAAELGLTPSSRSGVKATKPVTDANAGKRRKFFGNGSGPRTA